VSYLLAMQLVPFEEQDAVHAAKLRADLRRRGRPIGDLDSLIAAQALARDLILVTNNLREFDRIAGLRTENWVSP
jgi:tRNA(fMet)-specific endonuclease VapC